MTLALEPGEQFVIEYGKGHRLNVVCLDLRTKNKIAKLMSEAVGSQEAFDKLEQAVILCSPAITDDDWKRIDERSAGEIVGKTLSNASLNEDEQKKFESPR